MDPNDPRLPYDVLIAQRLHEGEIVFEWQDQRRPADEPLDRLIEATWQRKTADARRRGQLLFNGKLVRYLGHELQDGRLIIQASETDYREFVGTNLESLAACRALPRPWLSNPIGATAAIITADGFLVHGRRSERVAYHPGYLHTFGGGLEPGDRDDSGSLNVFAALGRELEEELSVAGGEITETVFIGMMQDRLIAQPEMLFDVRLPLTYEQLRERHCDDEHKALVACRRRPDAIAPFIRSSDPIAPVSVAALMLHGLQCWGEAWHEQTVRELAS